MMFQKIGTVYITKTKVVVRSGDKKPLALAYDGGSLEPHFSKLKKVYNPKSVRVILGDSSSYFVFFKTPQSKVTEQEIFAEARTIIPENLTADTYDWREVGTIGTDQLIEVFVAPYDLVRELSKASRASAIPIEGIMPVAELLAKETEKVKEPHVLMWEGEEQLLVFVKNGIPYASLAVTDLVKADLEELLATVKNDFGLSASHVFANSDTLAKKLVFPKTWKVEKRSLDPHRVLQGMANIGKENKAILAARVISGEFQAASSQENELDLSNQFEDESEIIAPQIAGFSQQTEDVKSTSSGRSRFLKLGIFVLGVLVLLGAFVVYALGSKSNSNLPETLSPTQAPVEIEAQSLDETELEQEEIDLSNYTVQVQNGSGQAGVAGGIAELMENADFVSVEVGNAESLNYVGITIFIKEEVEEYVIGVIKEALADTEYQVSVSDDNLEADSEFDVIIIVGAS